jgi:hypothetical protein
MQFRTTGLLLLGAMVLPASGTAQTPPLHRQLHVQWSLEPNYRPSRTYHSISKR